MKHKYLIIITALIVLSSVIVSCTRSASGSPIDTVGGDSELPNPVSTQSQLMKDIISGTQTAMAVPLDATAEENTVVEGESTDAATTETTPEPDEVEEVIVLPTSTAGPPPEIVLNYNNVKCGPGYWLCAVTHQKDQSVTIQATYPWLLNDMELTFKMGPEGLYDYSQYIVVGTAKYTPDSSKGYGFKVDLNIPDSLRGTSSIVVRLETNDVNYFGSDYFTND